MTPKKEGGSTGIPSSDLDHCNAFGDAVIVLSRKWQIKHNEKFEALPEKIPITLRNLRRIIAGEIVPSLQTFQGLRRTLCEEHDRDKFDALFIEATQTKSRFSEQDISELIEFGSGVQCERKDTIDPKCFRAIAFSSQTKIDTAESGKKAMAYFRSLRSLLTSERLPARSDNDRRLRIALVLHREAWVARSMNKLSLHEQLLSALEGMRIEGLSSYIQASIVDHRLLASNNPEEVFFQSIEKPLIDAHVKGFQRSVKLFEAYDDDPRDQLKEYGIRSTADDAQINLLRYACMYGKDEAQAALSGLSAVRNRDEARGAPRFLTIYNDLVEIEARITLTDCSRAIDMIGILEREALEMGRSDLIGEIRMLAAKAHIKRPRSSRGDFDRGIAIIRSVIQFFAGFGNDVKVASLQRLLRHIEGVHLAKFRD